MSVDIVPVDIVPVDIVPVDINAFHTYILLLHCFYAVNILFRMETFI